jgi:hypothetical protein
MMHKVYAPRSRSTKSAFTSLVALAMAIIVALPIGSASVANAAGSWVERANSDSRNWLSIASSSDGKNLAAVVGYGGGIFTSTNSGATWTETNAGNRDWSSIASSSDGTTLVAAVTYGGIYRSTNSGLSWTLLANAQNRNWSAVTSSANGEKIFACESGGSIWSSIDSGANWTERTSAGSKNWISIASSADGTKVAAAQFYGYIFTSTDSGASWTFRPKAGSNSGNGQWVSIASSADGTKLAAVRAADNSVYTSVDSGDNWTARTGASGGSGGWQSIASSADGSVLAGAMNGKYVYLSTDSGVNFAAQTSTSTKAFRSIASSADGGKLAVTVDSGKIWSYSALAPAPTVTSVSPTSGAITGGTQITVTGTGFVDGARVTVGGGTCSNVTVVSATSITCVTPYLSPPTGSVGAKDVKVTNEDNQFDTATNAFTYVAAPTFTSVSPASGPVAGGTRITITGTDFVAGDTVTLYGARGLLGSCTSVNFISSTSLSCLTPAGQVGPADINVDDVYGQNALGTEAFTYSGPVFSATTPSFQSVRLGSPATTVQTVTITNTGNLGLKFPKNSLKLAGADSASFKVSADRCSRLTLAPNKACTVGVKFLPSKIGSHSATLSYSTNDTINANSIELSGVGLPKKISTVTISRIKATSGSTGGGTTVAITGTGFNSQASVTIDGAVATVLKRRGSTSITVSTPAHAAGKVLVAVTNPDSGTGSYNGFTYVP